MQEVAPKLYARIRPRVRKSRKVADALGGAWPRDVGPDLQTNELLEYLALWEMTMSVDLHEGTRDGVRWAWEASGEYSACSAYASWFVGREHDRGELSHGSHGPRYDAKLSPSLPCETVVGPLTDSPRAACRISQLAMYR